jgi:hypothetical protein
VEYPSSYVEHAGNGQLAEQRLEQRGRQGNTRHTLHRDGAAPNNIALKANEGRDRFGTITSNLLDATKAAVATSGQYVH